MQDAPDRTVLPPTPALLVLRAQIATEQTGSATCHTGPSTPSRGRAGRSMGLGGGAIEIWKRRYCTVCRRRVQRSVAALSRSGHRISDLPHRNVDAVQRPRWTKFELVRCRSSERGLRAQYGVSGSDARLDTGPGHKGRAPRTFGRSRLRNGGTRNELVSGVPAAKMTVRCSLNLYRRALGTPHDPVSTRNAVWTAIFWWCGG